MAPKIGNMRISGFVAGVILTVLGALMIAESVFVITGNTSFMFADSMNQGFEFVVGLIAVVLASMVMDLSRA